MMVVMALSPLCGLPRPHMLTAEAVLAQAPAGLSVLAPTIHNGTIMYLLSACLLNSEMKFLSL